MNQFLEELGKLGDMPANLSIWQVVITLGLSFVLSLLVSLFYIKTFRGRYYSQTFIHTLIIVSVVISLVILVIGTNIARAFSLAGALSIIRFRSAIRDPRDVAFIFFAMGIGLACGSQYYLPAIVFTLLMGVVIFFLYSSDFARRRALQKILKITMPENLNYEGMFDDLFKKYLEEYTFLSVKTTNLGTVFEVSYSIRHKPESGDKILMDEIRVRNGNLGVSIVLDQQNVDWF